MADYTVSSGNIFKDLGFPNPDEELAKVKLASKINRLITDKGMTQKEAAEFLGISRSKISDLRNGRLGKFTLELLFSLLGKLHYQIEIRVIPKSEYEPKETISIAQI
ncbi:MAG: helix-turn-helix domain-containing protein [Candidatus Poribacteria bacterium]